MSVLGAVLAVGDCGILSTNGFGTWAATCRVKARLISPVIGCLGPGHDLMNGLEIFARITFPRSWAPFFLSYISKISYSIPNQRNRLGRFSAPIAIVGPFDFPVLFDGGSQ